MIHVNRGATSLGVFSEEEIREGLRTGRFAPSDIGWREGMATWQPLSQFPELAGDRWTRCSACADRRRSDVNICGTARGLPWEHRQERGFFNAFIETLSMVLTQPAEAFTCDEARRWSWRTAHLRAHRRMRGRHRVVSLLARFALHRLLLRDKNNVLPR